MRNKHDGAACAAPFTDDADFTDIHGTKGTGREVIAKSTAHILATVYEGTKLTTTVESIRFIRPDVASVDVIQELKDRKSIPFGKSHVHLIVVKENERWSIVVFHNMIPVK